MMKLGLFDNEQKESRKVVKAFLITGGTEHTRQEKYYQLARDDCYNMYGAYKGENELAVIFSGHHSDFKDMTFEKAKALAGSQKLGADFPRTTVGKKQGFGIIDITGIEDKPSFRW